MIERSGPYKIIIQKNKKYWYSYNNINIIYYNNLDIVMDVH